MPTKHTQKKSKVSQSKRSGFTLVELLVVISVIGVLAALLLANFVGVRNRASDATIKNNASQLKTALRLYYNDYQQFPASSNGVLLGCGTEGTEACSPSQPFSAGEGNTMYMQQLPEAFEYYSDGLDSFLIVVELGNPSDQGLAESLDTCDPDSRNYVSGEFSELSYFVCE